MTIVSPIFSTWILYVIISPLLISPSPLSVTSAVFVASMAISPEAINTMVGSSAVFPSVSSPSSLTSLTSLLFPGLLPLTVTVLITLPEPNEDSEII